MKTGRRRTLSARIGASAVVLSLFSALLSAQVGELAGTVRDENGKPRPGVSVEIAGKSLIEKVRTTTTDREGTYKFTAVPIGMFTITFRAQGFSTLLHTNVLLSSGLPAGVDAQLTPGEMSEVVVVKHKDPEIFINGKPYVPKPEPAAEQVR